MRPEMSEEWPVLCSASLQHTQEGLRGSYELAQAFLAVSSTIAV
jgi:hypothetical protein